MTTHYRFHMKKLVQGLLILMLFFSVVPKPAEAALPDGFEIKTIVSGLNLPTAFAFAPGNKIFVAQKGGTIRLIENGVLNPTPVIAIPNVNQAGDRGVLGIATDPNFQTNGYIYVFHTHETNSANPNGPKTGILRRLTVVNNVASMDSSVILLGTTFGSALQPSCTNFPVTADCVPSDSLAHSTGGIYFGPDGKLWIATGDGSGFNGNDPLALRSQSLDALSGKILRINPDGTAPADNPFYNGDPNANRSKVWALGFRNPFRLTFRPATGKPYLADVGWYSYEEINFGTKGANYGWPCREGDIATTYNCTPSSATTEPFYKYGRTDLGASITGGAFSGNAYPAEYRDQYFFADFSNDWMKRMTIDPSDSSIVSIDNVIDSGAGGIVDIKAGPDGSIYYISIYTGSINKIEYDSNRQPTAVIAATPTNGTAPLSVQFNSAGTNDPDGNLAGIEWNFGDGSPVSTEAAPTHTYALGTYTATLTARDTLGRTGVQTVTIYSGTEPTGGQGNTKPHLTAVTTDPNPTVIGRDVKVSATVTNAGGTDPFVVDIEIYNAAGNLVGSRAWENISLENGATETFSFDWLPPLIGTYRVSVGLFYDGWTGLHEWNNFFYEFEVGERIPVTENLIANPSLETEGSAAGVPASWEKGGYGTNTRTFTYPVTGSGSARAARIDMSNFSSGDAKWMNDPVPVVPGTQYLVSSRYRSDVTTTVTARIIKTDGTSVYKWVNDTLPTEGWAQFEGTFTAPANAASVVIFHLIRTNGYLETDDYSLSAVASAYQGDTVRPTLNITAPTFEQTISGTFSFAVTANDDKKVKRVQLILDGKLVGGSDLTAPFNFSYDTSTLVNGTHVVQAQVWDAAGNTRTTLPLSFTVQNGGSALTPSGTGSLDFDGVDDYVNFERWNIEETNGFTVEALYTPKIVTADGVILSKSDVGSVDWELGYKALSGGSVRPYFTVKTQEGAVATAEGGAISGGELAHISGVFDGMKIRLYKNGSLAAETALAGTVATSQKLVYMGARPDMSQPLKGELDSVRVWTVPKTITEIQSMVNTEEIGTGNGLIKHWKLNEGFGQDVIDSSNSGHHGVLGNSDGNDENDPRWIGGLGNGSTGTFSVAYVATTISDNRLAPGEEVTITSSVKNTGDSAGFAILYYDIFDETGTRVYNRYFDGESLLVGEQRDFSINWSTNTPGRYRVAFAAIKLNWSGLYHWENSAATFIVETNEHQVYDDALKPGWANWSWETTTDFSNADSAHEGTQALSVTPTTPWSGLYLHTEPLATDNRTMLNFAIKGKTAGGQVLQLRLYDENRQGLPRVPLAHYLPDGVKSDAWSTVIIPLADLGAGGAPITGFVIQGMSGAVEPVYLLDAIKFQ